MRLFVCLFVSKHRTSSPSPTFKEVIDGGLGIDSTQSWVLMAAPRNLVWSLEKLSNIICCLQHYQEISTPGISPNFLKGP